MSAKVSGQVWELDLPHPEMLVLQAMADHADHEGDNIYPSVGLIAWKVGYSVRQTQRVIQNLQDKAILILEEEGGTRGSTNVYSIDFSAAPRKPAYEGRDKLSPDQRETLLYLLFERYGPICQHCGREGSQRRGPDGEAWNIDRVIPGIQGGRYEPDNITLLCAHCNRGKGPNKRRSVRHSAPVGGVKMSRPNTDRGVTSAPVGHDILPLGGDICDMGHDIQVSPEPSGNRPVQPSAAATGAGARATGAPVEPDPPHAAADSLPPAGGGETESPEELARRLTDAGLNGDVAVRLAQQNPEECRRQLAYLPFVTGWKSGAGAYLRRGIEGRWGAPPGYKQAEEAKQKAVQKQQQQDRVAVQQRNEDEEKAVLKAAVERAKADPDRAAEIEAEARERLRKRNPVVSKRLEQGSPGPAAVAALEAEIRAVVAERLVTA